MLSLLLFVFDSTTGFYTLGLLVVTALTLLAALWVSKHTFWAVDLILAATLIIRNLVSFILLQILSKWVD